ncbi:major facilitator superfamily domain-containing protein 8-like [Stigmatopora nigra]
MAYLPKRKLTFITIGLIFLLSGIEYAVILPTIWRYLQILRAPPYFLGLTLSAFSLSGLLSGPVFGRWSDDAATGPVLLLANLFQIVGSFLYFVGYSKWLLVASRLVAGVGAGAGSSVFAFLTRITRPEERAGVFAAVMACRQAGLLVGPALNLFLQLCDFKLGVFVVDRFTSPGIFMCLSWSLLQFAILATPWESDSPDATDSTDATEEMALLATEPRAEGDRSPTRWDGIRTGTYGASDSTRSEAPCRFGGGGGGGEFLREEVIVLLAAQFVTLFNQTALETAVTPLTQRSLGMGESGNSAMYGLCGAEVILGFLLVRRLGGKMAERAALAAGLLVCCLACVWFLLFLCDLRGSYEWKLSVLVVGIFLQLLGLPFVAVSQASLFSKVTAASTQGFSQGIRRSVGGLATILGPLWAGGLTNHLYVMTAMMLALLLMLAVMTALSYDRLTAPLATDEAEPPSPKMPVPDGEA